MTNKCNFCKKSQHQVNKLILGEKAGICDKCIKLCSRILLDDLDKKMLDDITDIDPIALKEYLDEFVVSQDSAKIILCVAVANHFKRINSPDIKIDKSNVLLVGPTGSGKTLLAKTIAGYLDVPFVIADATTLTESGYVGEDVDSILTKLISAANGDIKRAEKGIVFIDEIDKIAKNQSSSQTKEVGGEGVQQALLKLVEGTMYTVAPNRRNEGSTVEIETSGILFIASGAFVGLDKIKKRKNNPSQIGFTADVLNEVIPEAEFTDFIQFGLIPEFVGRFPVVAEVAKLSKEDMLCILSTVENNLVGQFQHLFKYNKVKLSFDKGALNQVVDIAIKKKTGARSLRSIMEKALLPHMYNMNKYVENDINKVRITKKLINSPKEVKKG